MTFQLDDLASLLTLTLMEIVLGIDNVIFVAILVDRIPAAQQKLARQVGIGLALVMRLALLLSIRGLMGLTEPLLTLFGKSLTGREIILLIGGAFLIGKATREIHHSLEAKGEPAPGASVAAPSGIGSAILQIIGIDLVLSVDSVITAVGMARKISVMAAAMIIAVGVMFFASGVISGFIRRHPTLKMLALAFLILIGVTLVADGLGNPLNRGYIYSAIAFSLLVEVLNIRLKK